MLLGDVGAVDDHLAGARDDAHDLALVPPVLAGEHADAVALLDLESCHVRAPRVRGRRSS